MSVMTNPEEERESRPSTCVKFMPLSVAEFEASSRRLLQCSWNGLEILPGRAIFGIQLQDGFEFAAGIDVVVLLQ